MSKKITQNVNKDKFLNDLPKVKPDFSKWLSRHANYQSCNLGDIVPIYYDEILPNEKRKITLGMISHMGTPVAPFFNAGYTEIRCFFVPHRLSADLLNGYASRKSPWVKVFGEDNLSTSAEIIVPLADQKLYDVTDEFVDALSDSIGNLDSNDNVFNSLDISGAYSYKDLNFLQLAAYELIYQRHYRNENYESATESPLYRLLFDAYNNDSFSTLEATFTFEKANREKDYFTGAKPFTQKGDPIRVGLGDSAEIVGASDLHSVGSNGIKLDVGNSRLVNNSNGKLSGNITSDPISGTVTEISKINLVADLKNAKGISIEELRLLIKTQELLEKDAIYGTRYSESLNAHFGCAPLDLTLQDPQELYRTTITSNMQAIFQTSSTSGEQSILGTIGANSTTQTDPFIILPETTFYEHGILMICAVHKLQNVYDSYFFKPKFITKKKRFDFYTPELNDLGFQPVTKSEMVSANSDVVGFNEAFAEYRYSFNKVHGRLVDEFPYWAPAISGDYTSINAMYKEDTAILDKALSVRSTTAPQFYDAWGFEEECTKPMSLHSIPGMDGVI